jgi:hypothetical protein
MGMTNQIQATAGFRRQDQGRGTGISKDREFLRVPDETAAPCTNGN